MLIRCHSTLEPFQYFGGTGRCFSFRARVCVLLWRSDANNVVNVIISDNRQMKPRLYWRRDLLRYTEWQRVCVCVCLRWLKTFITLFAHQTDLIRGDGRISVIFPHVVEDKGKKYQICSRLYDLPKWVIHRRKPRSSSRCSDPTFLPRPDWKFRVIQILLENFDGC